MPNYFISRGNIKSIIHSVIGWKIYYKDNIVISSKDMKWIEAPPENILVIVIYENRKYKCYYPSTKEWKIENYKYILHEFDYYWLMENEDEIEFGCGNAMNVPLENKAPIIKKGIWVTNEEFKDTIQKTMNDNLWIEE